MIPAQRSRGPLQPAYDPLEAVFSCPGGSDLEGHRPGPQCRHCVDRTPLAVECFQEGLTAKT